MDSTGFPAFRPNLLPAPPPPRRSPIRTQGRRRAGRCIKSAGLLFPVPISVKQRWDCADDGTSLQMTTMTCSDTTVNVATRRWILPGCCAASRMVFGPPPKKEGGAGGGEGGGARGVPQGETVGTPIPVSTLIVLPWDTAQRNSYRPACANMREIPCSSYSMTDSQKGAEACRWGRAGEVVTHRPSDVREYRVYGNEVFHVSASRIY
eukprot:gene7786-biopygen12085